MCANGYNNPLNVLDGDSACEFSTLSRPLLTPIDNHCHIMHDYINAYVVVYNFICIDHNTSSEPYFLETLPSEKI